MTKLQQAKAESFSVFSVTEETQFLEFMFPQVVQRQ